MGTCYYIHEVPENQKRNLEKIKQIQKSIISNTDSLFTIESIFDQAFHDLIKGLHKEITSTLDDFFKNKEKEIFNDYEIHIGKFVGGYRFIFTDYKESYDAWEKYIKASDGKIYDEYGRPVSTKDMLEIIERSESNPVQSTGRFYYKNSQGKQVVFDVLSGHWC